MGFFGIKKAEKAKVVVAAGKDKVIPIRLQGETTFKQGCKVCPLDKEAAVLEHPRMGATGADDPILYFLNEVPSTEEDEEGEHFLGSSGELIREYLPNDLYEASRWSSIVQCHTPGRRQPTANELACCSQRTVADIEKTKPLVIVGCGFAPLNWAINRSDLSNWRGQIIPIKVGNWSCWYAPILNPAFALRKEKESYSGAEHVRTLKRDLDRVIKFIKGDKYGPPWIPEGEELSAGLSWELSWDVDAVAENLKALSKFRTQSVDIETNMLRPYRSNSKILSIAFGTWERSYAIPILHREAKWTPSQLKKVWKLIGDHLRNRKITFWAHHLKFETEWLSMPFALGRDILFEVNWEDTMAQAYVLGTRDLKGNSLDSRCIAMFGIPEKQLDDLDRARLDDIPLPKVLRYNARDTKFTDKLQEMQSELVEDQSLQAGYRLIVSRVPALTLAQQFGVVPDSDYAEVKRKELQGLIDGLEKKIQALPDVKDFVRERGKPFSTTSSQQLTALLRDKLKLREGWREENGVKRYSTDEDVLSAIKHPIGSLILEKRGWEKLVGTYIKGLCAANPSDEKLGRLIWDDGLVHTIYNYLLTVTGRLSSEDPNLQNFPKREHKEIRRVIRALLRHFMVSIDYGQIEARVIAMASQCPVLCQALWDHYDIHMAWAKIIAEAHPHVMVKYMKEAKKDETKAMKLFRSDVKNQWTFPLFFGSVLPSVAKSLNIKPDDLKPQFKKFWDMFEAVKKWQDMVVRKYQKLGYVETLTGRRRYEPMSLNEIINTPIQGTASDIVVDGMERCAEQAYERKRWQLAPRMNIHDDLTFYLPKESVEEDLDIIIPIMCQPRFDFVNVPITVEVAIGENWGDLEEFATVESIEYGYPEKKVQRATKQRGQRRS